MKCRRSEELFSDYVEGALPILLRTDLEDHLGSCSECQSLLACFREVVDALSTLSRPQPAIDLVERILEVTRPALPRRKTTSPVFPGFALPKRLNWAVWAAAAAFIALLFFRPPAPLQGVGTRISRLGHQTYSYGVRIYRGSERLIDDLNVLRMTVGVAFEDRLDQLNERLKDLEEARQKSENPPDRSSHLTPSVELSDMTIRPKHSSPRSLL